MGKEKKIMLWFGDSAKGDKISALSVKNIAVNSQPQAVNLNKHVQHMFSADAGSIICKSSPPQA